MAKKYIELLEESLPPPEHRMYKIWKQYALDAIKRGETIKKILSKFTSLDGLRVLGVGCGDGGLSIAFAKGKTEVCGVDIDYTRIKRSKVRALEEGTEVNFLVADGLHLPFRSSVFDVVICSDLIEHVPEPRHLIDEITKGMKGQGLLYLSAPNRLSPYQIIHDGHYGLFGVSLMPRIIAKHYVTKVRKIVKDYDVYRLPTYWYLKNILSKFNLKFTDCSCEYYLSRKLNMLWVFLLKSRLWNIISKIITPTFILICRREDENSHIL